MGVIRGVLKEELQNSLDMQRRYREEIARVKGCLIKKKIGRRYYYYNAKRQGSKVRFIYLGPISPDIRKKHAEQRKMLLKFRKLLLQVNGQIRFIRRALRGKETV